MITRRWEEREKAREREGVVYGNVSKKQGQEIKQTKIFQKGP